mgnify:CR=1 FL=1
MLKPKKDFRCTKVVVAGCGPFPIDMLRYDSCVPQTEIEVAALVSASGDYKTRRVQLYRYSYDATPATAARWQSFGWTIVSDEGRTR